MKLPKPPKQSTIDAAIDALNKVRRRWHRLPEVTATDVGFRIEGDKLTDTVALRVHVQRKRPVSELVPSEVFNEAGEQRTIGGFPVDVIEAAYTVGSQPPVALEEVAAEQVNRRLPIRPLIGGISVGNPRITAGTLGAIVFGRRSCQAYLLSNFHVLAGAPTAEAGEAILQPGRSDGGRNPTDRVATLDRFRIDARMDAAVARIDPGIGYDREVLGLGTITGMTTPALGMQVVKSGRTTGVTEGVIDGVSTAVTIDYEGPIGLLTLTDQVHIVPRPPWPRVDREVAEGGDSGAIWLEDATRRAVGLTFAGDNSPIPAAESAIGTPIDRVMAEFDVSFLPVLCPPSAQAPTPRDLSEQFPRLRELVRRQSRHSVPLHGSSHCCCSSGLDEQTLTELTELLDESRTE